MGNFAVFRPPPRPRPQGVGRTVVWREPGPQAGYPFESTQSTIYSGSGFSLQTGASPAVQIGDTILTSKTTPGGYNVLVNPDGTVVVNYGSDTSRQEFTYLLFRRQSGTLDGPGTAYINESPPVWNSVVSVGASPGYVLSVNLASSVYTTSHSGDTLTFALASGTLPPEATLNANGMLTGTLLTLGTYAFTVSATDSTGTSTTSPTCTITLSIYAPPPPTLAPAPKLLAPPVDTAGAMIDARIAAIQAIINANILAGATPLNQSPLLQSLNQWQVEAVDHYMVTGWANAGALVTAFPPPAWDAVGQRMLTRIAFLQNLANNPPAMPPGNANGYGSSGWTTIGAAYAQQLYAKQMELVQHVMDLPGGTPAATIIANTTGVQTNPAGIAYQYKFNSVGFTDADIED